MKKVLVKNQAAFNVTFNYNVVSENPVESVTVLGDFNEWSIDNGYELKKNKKGDFEGTYSIPAGRDYHFRYLVNGVRWANEKDADRFETSPLHRHIDNSVLSLPHVDVPAPASKPASTVKPAVDGGSQVSKKTASKPKSSEGKAPAKKVAAKPAEKVAAKPAEKKSTTAPKAAPKAAPKTAAPKTAAPKTAAPKAAAPAKKR